MSFALSFASVVFLPPQLLALLESIASPQDTGPIDLHRSAFVPAFHALSPIFLSLYYYHLNPDFYVRNFVFSSFLMPDFLPLVKCHEPRALVVIAWWFAMAGLVPRGWWIGECVTAVVDAAGRFIRRDGDIRTAEVYDGAERSVHLYEKFGREEAAKSVFDNWEGVTWANGPGRAEEWERNMLLDIDFDLNISG